MTDKVFLDTNVVVYAFDADAPRKQELAREILHQEGNKGNAVVSTQVLQEFYVSVTRKLAVPLDAETAFEATRALAELQLVQVDVPLVLRAARLSSREQLSFWDALIVGAAATAGCKRLYSEDLQDGRDIEGLRIANPFRRRTRR
jgi:predicted nucleic acid-binding protein